MSISISQSIKYYNTLYKKKEQNSKHFQLIHIIIPSFGAAVETAAKPKHTPKTIYTARLALQ